MENSTVVSTVFGGSSIAYLSIVSMVSSTGKSNRCLNNFLVLEYCQVIHTFNLSYNLKNLTVVSAIFWPLTTANLSIKFQSFLFLENSTVVSTIFWPWIIATLSIASIVSFPGKSNR